MKTLAMLLILLFAIPDLAADVTITIIIPDQYVSRVQAAVEGQIFCGELGAKACLTKRIKNDIKGLVRAYEKGLAAKAARDAVEDIGVD